MRVSIIIQTGSLLLLAASVFAQTVTSDSALTAANRLYNTGSYELAELTARRRIELGPIADSIRIEGERIIAFSLVAQAKPDLAREHFESILSLAPSFNLDPILTSPKILAVFQDAKIHSNAARTTGTIDATPLERDGTTISYRALLFPGWEQIHSGRSVPGFVFAGAGILSLGSAVTFEILRSPARKDYLAATQPADIANKYSKYNRAYRGEVYSLIAFAAIYVASEFDVFLNAGNAVSVRATSNGTVGPGIVFAYQW